MTDLYKLVFRGEVLDGQHPAVVRKRLGEAAAFDEAALEKLFSGRPVVLKRAADTGTAARLQALFRKSGARLRVLPVDAEDEVASSRGPAGEEPAPDAAAPQSARARASATGKATDEPTAEGLHALPPGSDLLREDERETWEPREVDTSNLTLEGARFVVDDDPPAPPAPDVSHLTVAEPGSDLGPAREAPEHPLQAPDLQVADVGETLGPASAPATPAVDFADLTFEVAPAGSDLGERRKPTPPSAPDTSHLHLADPS